MYEYYPLSFEIGNVLFGFLSNVEMIVTFSALSFEDILAIVPNV